MILDTRYLFCSLLREFEIATVCDVGSMDGKESLRFRRALPHAKILALEPNPGNLEAMNANVELRDKSITVLPIAAGDRSATSRFFTVKADYGPHGDPFRRGTGSLIRRSSSGEALKEIEVPVMRLDDVLNDDLSSTGPIALWIDVEGTAYEVLRGARRVIEKTFLVHVEVETVRLFGPDQYLFADVCNILSAAGFVVYATDQKRKSMQFNALFIRHTTLNAKPTEVRRWARCARIRLLVYRRIVHLLPHSIRRKLRLHLTETRIS